MLIYAFTSGAFLLTITAFQFRYKHSFVILSHLLHKVTGCKFNIISRVLADAGAAAAIGVADVIQ